MEGIGHFIIPLLIIIFAVVKVISAAAKKQPGGQAPVRRHIPRSPSKRLTPTARDDWDDLLEALGQKKENQEEIEPNPFRPASIPPQHPAVVPPKIPTLNIPAPAPPLPPVVSTPVAAPAQKFVRVSDYSSKRLDQIDQREFEVQRNLAEKFAALEGNISSVESRDTAAEGRPVEHPIHARFRNRKSIRDAIIMSEVLGSPLALR